MRVAARDGEEDIRQAVAGLGIDTAHRPQIQEGWGAFRGDDDVARVQVGMEDAVVEDLEKE